MEFSRKKNSLDIKHYQAETQSLHSKKVSDIDLLQSKQSCFHFYKRNFPENFLQLTQTLLENLIECLPAELYPLDLIWKSYLQNDMTLYKCEKRSNFAEIVSHQIPK